MAEDQMLIFDNEAIHRRLSFSQALLIFESDPAVSGEWYFLHRLRQSDGLVPF